MHPHTHRLLTEYNIHLVFSRLSYFMALHTFHSLILPQYPVIFYHLHKLAWIYIRISTNSINLLHIQNMCSPKTTTSIQQRHLVANTDDMCEIIIMNDWHHQQQQQRNDVVDSITLQRFISHTLLFSHHPPPIQNVSKRSLFIRFPLFITLTDTNNACTQIIN